MFAVGYTIHGRTIEREEDPHLPDGTPVEVELRTPTAPSFPSHALAQRLQTAAQTLLNHYLHDPELTAFSALDGEAWHEYR